MKFLGLIRANLFRKKIRFILTHWIVCGGYVPVWNSGGGACCVQWWR